MVFFSFCSRLRRRSTEEHPADQGVRRCLRGRPRWCFFGVSSGWFLRVKRPCNRSQHNCCQREFSSWIQLLLLFDAEVGAIPALVVTGLVPMSSWSCEVVILKELFGPAAGQVVGVVEDFSASGSLQRASRWGDAKMLSASFRENLSKWLGSSGAKKEWPILASPLFRIDPVM